MSDSCPDSNRKPSRRKKTLLVALKLVLSGASKAYAIYRFVSKVISICKEWLD